MLAYQKAAFTNNPFLIVGTHYELRQHWGDIKEYL